MSNTYWGVRPTRVHDFTTDTSSGRSPLARVGPWWGHAGTNGSEGWQSSTSQNEVLLSSAAVPRETTDMTAVDELWYLSDVAAQQAERTYHDLAEDHEGYMEFTRTRRVSRPRFRTVAERTEENGLPYGAHVVVYRDSGELLLVRHADVDMWVLPGGQVDDEDRAADGENGDVDDHHAFRAAAERELVEEAGVDAAFDGLAMLARVEFHCDGHTTWGVLPIYAGEATSTELTVDDPDDEITDAAWFDELPEDARDRDQLLRWRERHFGE